MPYAFTEQGVSMLSAVLRSDISANTGIIQRIETVERKQIETDKKIDKIFTSAQNHLQNRP
jgi:hypothetical protein